MKNLIAAFAMLLALSLNGQSRLANRPGGQFSLGVRSTTSLFSHESGPGAGFGGQFRLRLLRLINTEWYADYITSDVKGLGNRTDYHIGWSVMFYPSFAYFDNQRLKPQPYFIAGHCFDYTRVEGNNFGFGTTPHALVSRFSSAVQAGLGFHLPVHDRVDFSVSGQYMIHLGSHITSEVRTTANGYQYLYLDEEDSAGLEGHLLVTFSLNFRVADLWKNVIKGVQDKKPVEEEQQ